MNEPRLYIALYFDADIQFQITAQIEKHGYDVVHAHALKHSNWTDEQHLVFAAENNRALYTNNIQDFEPLYQKWWAARRQHSGIIVSPRWEAGVIVHRLLKLLNTLTADEMINNYKHLGEFGEFE